MKSNFFQPDKNIVDNSIGIFGNTHERSRIKPSNMGK